MTLRQKLEKLLKNFTHHHHSNEEDSAAAKVDDVESSTSTLSKHDVEFLFEIDSADKLAEKSALKKLQKLEKTLRAQYLNNSELLALLEYTRLVKQLILLVDLTRECIRRLILEATNKPVVSSSTEEIRTHSSKSECEKCREAFLTLSYILMYLTYSSRIFRLKLAQFEGIKVLVDLLRLVDDDLLIQCTNNIPSEKKRCHELCVIVKNTLFIVQNMTKSVDLAPDDVEWLKSLSGKIVDNDDVPDLDSNEKMMMFLFLSRVMSSRELGEFKRKNEFVIKMIQLIKSVVSKISIGDQPLRMSIDTNEVYERVESMYLVVGNELAVSLVDLLDCIQVLSTKGVMPWELVRNLNLIDELAAILTHGNECEVEHVLKIILSFGLEQSLYNENDILVIAKNILISQKFENRRIINCCKGIIWLNEAHYKDYICSEETQPNEEEIESTTPESKIFLCCDRNDVKLFEEIESELEKLGHKSIRTRYSNSYEPSLEQILTCINNSHCVLIGISPHIMTNCCCRLEIQFAQKINKLIVPVILDSSYEINGWLKQLINDTDVYQLDAIENSSWEDEMKRLNEFIKRKIELESEPITSSL